MSNFHEINFERIADGENEVEMTNFPVSSSSPSDGPVARQHLIHPEQSTPIPSSSTESHLNFGGSSTWFEGSFNFVNSILGAGIIGVPLAIMQCGLIIGLLVYALVAYFVYSSVLMLIQCGMKTRTFDLEELAEHTLGSLGYCMAVGSMFLMSYGGLVAYLVIIGDTVPMVANSISPHNTLNRETAMCIFATCIILPLSLFRDLSHLAWTSLLSVLLELGLLLVIILAAYQQLQSSSEHSNTVSSTASSSAVSYLHLSLFAGIGTMSFGLVCQHNSFLVFKSLQQPTMKTWRKVAASSVSFGFLLSLAFGLVGFFAFYPYVEGDILNNFPANSNLVTAGRSILASTMLFTYPMECYVSRHCLYSLIMRYRRQRRSLSSCCHWFRRKRRRRERGNHQRLVSSLPHSSSGDDFDNTEDDLPSPTWWQQLWSRRGSRGSRLRRSSSHPAMDQQQVVVGFELTHSTMNSQHVFRQNSRDHSTIDVDQSFDPQQDEDMVVISFREEEEQNETPEHSLQPSRSMMTLTSSRFVNPFAARQQTVNMVYFAETAAARSQVDTENPLHDVYSHDEEGESCPPSHEQPQPNVEINSNEHGFTSNYEHVFWTILLWGSSLLIAIVSTKLGVVSALTGAAAASTLGYTLPALIYLKVYEKDLYQAVSVILGIPPTTDSMDQEGQPDEVRASFWQAVRKFMPFILPISMLAFGVMVFFVGITTILMAAR